MLNEINGFKTQPVGSPRLRPADPAVVADNPFGSDDDLDAFLQGWSQSDTSGLDTLAQVAQAPVQAPALPTPEDDALFQLEHLVARNQKFLTKAAESLPNAPSRLLMTEDTSTFSAPSAPSVFNDANAWKLFDHGR